MLKIYGRFMKIIDGLQLKGRPAEIPNVLRENLPEFFADMGFKVGAEIGTAKGYFAQEFGKVGLKLYCIDPYSSYSDYNKGNGFTGALDNQYEQAKQRLAPYDCTIIKRTSMDAVGQFEDDSLDFVYIDGNHGYKYVTEDIFEWSKKVRKGGVVSGHDYIYTDRPFDNIHVKYVVDSYTKAFGIKQWYLLGRGKIGDCERVKDPTHKVTVHRNKEGEIRNLFRSWMWIKE
jgi:hypothetical protein